MTLGPLSQLREANRLILDFGEAFDDAHVDRCKAIITELFGVMDAIKDFGLLEADITAMKLELIREMPLVERMRFKVSTQALERILS